MKRRRFLQVTSLGTLAAIVPFVGASGALGPLAGAVAEPAFGPIAEPALLHALGDRRAIRRIGTLYRRSHPLEDDPAVLHDAIIGHVPAGSGSRQIRAALQRRVRDEFGEARTVQVDGWILARTEARQCALYDILHG